MGGVFDFYTSKTTPTLNIKHFYSRRTILEIFNIKLPYVYLQIAQFHILFHYTVIVYMLPSGGQVKILQPVAICSYFRNIFPPWSSQMTILLITNAMYHIRYTKGEYEFKRKKPPRIDFRETSTSPTDRENPPLYRRKPCRIPNVEWHSPRCVSKNTWAVANKTVDIQSTHHTINMSYRHSIIKTQRHSSKGTVIISSQEIPSNTSMHEY